MHVVVAWLHLDPSGRSPGELLAGWRDVARPVAEAAAAGTGARVTLAYSAWADERREVGGLPAHFVREANPVRRLPGGRTLRARPRRLFETIRSLEPDLVHVEGLSLPRQVRALARALPGVPIVAQDHGSRVPRGIRRLVARRGFAGLSGAIFTAAEQAEPFRAAGVLRPDLPVFEALEGSSPFMPGNREEARRATGITGDPCLLWLGNLDANKDPLTLLEGVARTAAELPGLHLHMCYRRAPLLEAVRERLQDSRLAGRVTLRGEVAYPHTEAYLQAADFLVQASHAEGSGFAVIEALACGATPIVTDIPSFRRITGNAGALVPLDDAGAFARALLEWSRKDRVELRAAARQRFESALTFGSVGRELRAAWDAVTARR